MGPNTAFVLAIFGLFGIYYELISPGRIYPILLGGGALVTGCYFLWRLSPSAVSLALIAAAAALFVAEFFRNTYFVASALGTAFLAASACKMFHTPPWIVPGLAVPLCCVFGAVTSFLCYSARRSREKKWSDVQPL
jgi:membrane-bound serine protease (ClpP class)